MTEHGMRDYRWRGRQRGVSHKLPDGYVVTPDPRHRSRTDVEDLPAFQQQNDEELSTTSDGAAVMSDLTMFDSNIEE